MIPKTEAVILQQMQQPPEVEGATLHTKDTLTAELRVDLLESASEAFVRSDFMRYMTRGRGLAALDAMMELSMVVAEELGWIYVIQDDQGIAACACWKVPSYTGIPIPLQLRLLPQTHKVCGWFGLPRMFFDAFALESAHGRASKAFKLVSNVPHAHLLMMWVREDRRGQGLCSRLIRGVTEQGDRRGFGTYLEADGAFNTTIVYPALGYVPCGRGQIGIWGGKQVVYTSMIRLPQRPRYNRLADSFRAPGATSVAAEANAR